MKARTPEELIQEIENFSPKVTPDAKFTIHTIRNLIESNSRVEEAIDQLHKSINNSTQQNGRLQKRIYYLTIVAVMLTLVQAAAVIVQFLNR